MKELSPFVFSSPTDYLKAVRQHYGSRKRKVSLQAWAQKLGYRTARSLELVISGHRLPSGNLIFKLSRDLHLSAAEHRYLQLMIQRERQLRRKQPVHEIENEMDRARPSRFNARYISNEIFHRVSEWYPLVLRQLSLTPNFRNDLKWINKKLRGQLTSSQIAAALAEWNQLAFDRRTLYTAEDIPSQAVRVYHQKMLHKAMEAIEEIPVTEREYIALTFRSSKKNMPKLKKLLREVRDQLNEDLHDESGNEVFQLCLALFPHTDLKS